MQSLTGGIELASACAGRCFYLGWLVRPFQPVTLQFVELGRPRVVARQFM